RVHHLWLERRELGRLSAFLAFTPAAAATPAAPPPSVTVALAALGRLRRKAVVAARRPRFAFGFFPVGVRGLGHHGWRFGALAVLPAAVFASIFTAAAATAAATAMPTLAFALGLGLGLGLATRLFRGLLDRLFVLGLG